MKKRRARHQPGASVLKERKPFWRAAGRQKAAQPPRARPAREGRGGRRPTRGPAEGRARLRRIWPAEKIFGGNAIKCRRPDTYLVEEKNDAKEGKP